MSLVTTGAGAALSAARARLAQMQERASRDMVENCLIETVQAMNGALTALLALSLGKEPLDADVQEELRKLAEAPASVHRWQRHWTEILKSPSRARRRRLAAVLAVGPKITNNEAERDQLDLLAEQLLERDLAALQFFARPGPAPGSWEARTRETHIGARNGVSWDLAHVAREVDPLSLERLLAVGCLARIGDAPVHVELTVLGEFLLKHMNHEAIRSGVASGDADATG